MFSYLTLDQRVRADHPLREIRALTDGVLRPLNAEFDKLYAATGRASVAPEYILNVNKFPSGPVPISRPKTSI